MYNTRLRISMAKTPALDVRVPPSYAPEWDGPSLPVALPLQSSFRTHPTTGAVTTMRDTMTTVVPTVINTVCVSCGRPIGDIWQSIHKASNASGPRSLSDVYTDVFQQYGVKSLCCRAVLMGTPLNITTEIRRLWSV